MRFQNIILFVLLLLTLAINLFASPWINQKSYEIQTGDKNSGKVWVNYRDILAEKRDKEIRELLQKYKAQGKFKALEPLIVLRYRGKMYLTNRDILSSFGSLNSLNILFDQFSPLEVKKLPTGTIAKILDFKIPRETKLYEPGTVNIVLEVEGNKFQISFVNFEQIFIYPKEEQSKDFIRKSANTIGNKMCMNMKLYPFSNIETIISKKTRVIDYMKKNSPIFNRIVGKHYFDVSEDSLNLCYAINTEMEDDLATLQANLKIVLTPYRIGNENI